VDTCAFMTVARLRLAPLRESPTPPPRAQRSTSVGP
jgi:hypothetical protein